MKKVILSCALLISSSISIAILSLVAPISSILFGTKINDSSSFLTYLDHFDLIPVLIIFSFIFILGLFLTIKELLTDIRANKK